MQYRVLGSTGLRVSVLGFGTMRLPQKDGGQGYTGIAGGNTSEEDSIRVIRHAVDHGINYIDTAYNYLDGESEKILGKALKDGYRERVVLTTKAPTWLYKCPEDFDRCLDEQLKRLDTDHVDIYLLHGVNTGSWQKKILRYDVIRKLEEAKAAGKIRYIGFSFHDDLNLFREILDYYDGWDVCQIQLNYMDTDFQAGITGLEYAAGKGLGIMIMEPLRGGYLAGRLPDPARDIFTQADPGRTPAQWAFDFLWDRPEIGVVLSGLSDIDQIDEDIRYADNSRVGCVTKEDRDVYARVLKCLDTYPVIPCTGCAYCMHCPKHLAIPYIFRAYNEYQTTGDLKKTKVYYHREMMNFGARADHCIACKQCESICPQHIPISDWMPKIDALLGEYKEE